jgi:hypothetical protein
MKSDLSDTWAELEREAATNRKPHALIRRIIPKSSLDAFIGIEFPDERKLFALEVNLNILESIDSFPAFKGLEVEKRDSVVNQENKAALLIVLKAARFSDVFCALIGDIASELQTAKDEESALAIIVSRLIEWQQLTESGNQERLSAEAVRGLYGELYFLSTHLIHEMGASAVFGWKGFNASHQDYYFGNRAIEVKTTKAKQHQKLNIASERQLDESPFDKLFVYHLSVNELPGNNNTLPSIVNRIRKSIASDRTTLEYFEEALFQVGYFDDQRKVYEKVGFELREENLFSVEGDFPRIVEGDLRSGVGDVTYSINVAECKHFSVELSAIKVLSRSL